MKGGTRPDPLLVSPKGCLFRRLCLLTEGALVEVTSRLLGQLRHGLLD